MFAKQASEPQILQPALAFHARVLLAAGRTNEAGAQASELLVMLATILESADAGTQQRLLGIIDALGRQAGCGDAFDEWGSDYVWMQQYRPPEASP